jgi:hypothetical protein
MVLLPFSSPPSPLFCVRSECESHLSCIALVNKYLDYKVPFDLYRVSALACLALRM